MKTPPKTTLLLLIALLLSMGGWMSACSSSRYQTGIMQPIFESNGNAGSNPERQAFDSSLQRLQQQLQIAGQASPNGLPDQPFALANPGEDIWVIVRPARREAVPESVNHDEHPGAGALAALIPAEDENTEPALVALPLAHTDVSASIAGYIATVDVTQQFTNPYSGKIEAVYQFPLPQDAAISAFVMEVGPENDRRRIRGIIREREEAEQIYREARAQGYNASLLTQSRPNIFEQRVANIEPGRQIDIQIRYFNTLSYNDGWYSFVFPMVVGPRFNPPNTDDPVHAVGHGSPQALNTSGNGTTISYLRPDERSGHDITLSLAIDAGVSIQETRCPTHAVITTVPTRHPNTATVELSPNGTIPNRDFVFSFRVTGQQMKSGLLTHVDEQGQGYFSLMLYPPADLESFERQPMEMVFVLDCSGSMNGPAMGQAKDAIRHALRQLQPDDSFQIICFSDTTRTHSRRPLPANADNIRGAIRYVDVIRAEGGTMMADGMREALRLVPDDNRYRVVTFLTDGFIGNEAEILEVMEQHLGSARVFSFGVGTSTNRFLLERMASVGRGAAAYLLPGDSGADVMDLYFDRVCRPGMTDLAVSWGAAEVTDVYPQRMPDLIVGRPVILTGRYTGQLDDIRITGQAGNENRAIAINASAAAHHPALGQVWARRRIADLMNQMTIAENDALEPDVRQTALQYSLVSQYTAFMAIDASRRTEGDRGTTVNQSVPVPEGVRYDTTVEE